MQTLSETPVNAQNMAARPAEDVVYQLVTVGAILLVLSSLWIF